MTEQCDLQELPDIHNVNDILSENNSLGHRASEWLSTWMGSWSFILYQTIFLLVWIGVNIVAWVEHWDPYPFVFLNLILGFFTAYSGPIIMMSQNRQIERDRIVAHNDYEIDLRSVAEIRYMIQQLLFITSMLSDIHGHIEESNGSINMEGYTISDMGKIQR